MGFVISKDINTDIGTDINVDIGIDIDIDLDKVKHAELFPEKKISARSTGSKPVPAGGMG